MRKSLHHLILLMSFFLLLTSCTKKDNDLLSDVNAATVVQQIKTQGLFNIVIPHRIDDLERIKMVKTLGYRGWELDLRFGIEDGKSVIRVKHDEVSSDTLSLEEYLQIAQMNSVDKLWFDVKNMDDTNIDMMFDRLNQLDSMFGLKNIVILETGFKSEKVKVFSDDGWHTSYYLPYWIIDKWIQDGDSTSMSNYSSELEIQLSKQAISAVSFDVSCYPFVINYLESKIDADIVYHCWDMSLNLSDGLFIDNYLEKIYSDNSRIKTVLIPIY